jgi:putative salt-induced outer membrane protein
MATHRMASRITTNRMTTNRILANRFAAIALLVLAPTIGAWADEAPPPPQGVWIGKGQFGFLSSRGNSDSQSINGDVDMLRYDGAWKNELDVSGLYGKNSGIVSAERWLVRGQSNYTISGDLFSFGGLRYEHDLFDGFQYQASVTAGFGYKLVNTDDTKLTAQAGAGYRRLRPEIIDKDTTGAVISRTPLDASGEPIATAGVDFSQIITKTTIFTNKFVTEAGSSDVLLHDELALTVKMSDKLALSVGYGITDNTKPPPPLKKLDTVASVNLVFGF